MVRDVKAQKWDVPDIDLSDNAIFFYSFTNTFFVKILAMVMDLPVLAQPSRAPYTGLCTLVNNLMHQDAQVDVRTGIKAIRRNF